MKITIEGCILKTPYDSYTHANCDMTDCGYITIGPHTIEYEIPADFDPIKAEVAMLQAKLDEEETAHRAKTSILRDKIASLLCIENNPTVSEL